MKFKNFRLFLLGLLVVSTTSFAETKNKPTIPSNNQYEQQNKISKETLFAKLSLSKDQKLKLNNAFSEFEKASNSLSSSKNQDFSAIRSKRESLINNLNNKAKAILNGKQYSVYKQNIDQYLPHRGGIPANS